MLNVMWKSGRKTTNNKGATGFVIFTQEFNTGLSSVKGVCQSVRLSWVRFCLVFNIGQIVSVHYHIMKESLSKSGKNQQHILKAYQECSRPSQCFLILIYHGYCYLFPIHCGIGGLTSKTKRNGHLKWKDVFLRG